MIKINLILGFLGAGKTTFIKSLLQKEILKDERIVLLVNDYGPENYDSRILSDTGSEIIEITNGCLCCSNQDEFQEILLTLSRRQDIDRIIVEPSGLFFPDQIISDIKKDPLQSFLKLEPIYVVLDMEFLSRSTRVWPPFISRHIEIADYIVANKLEQNSGIQSEMIKNQIYQINKKANQLSFTEAIENFKDHKKLITPITNPASKEGHDIKLEFVTENISFTDLNELNSYFNKQGDSLLRAKGIVLLEGEKVFVNYTQSSTKTELISTLKDPGLTCFYS